MLLNDAFVSRLQLCTSLSNTVSQLFFPFLFFLFGATERLLKTISVRVTKVDPLGADSSFQLNETKRSYFRCNFQNCSMSPVVIESESIVHSRLLRMSIARDTITTLKPYYCSFKFPICILHEESILKKWCRVFRLERVYVRDDSYFAAVIAFPGTITSR